MDSFSATGTIPICLPFPMLLGPESFLSGWGRIMNFVSPTLPKMQTVQDLASHGKESPSCRSSGICPASSMPATSPWPRSLPFSPNKFARQMIHSTSHPKIHSSVYPCPTFRNVRGSREDRRFYTTVRRLWYSPTLPIIPLPLPVPLNPCVPAGRDGDYCLFRTAQ